MDMGSLFQGQSPRPITYIEGSRIHCHEQSYRVCSDDEVSIHCAKFVFHLHWDVGVVPPMECEHNTRGWGCMSAGDFS